MKKHTTKELVQAARVARRCVEPERFEAIVPTVPEESGIEGRNGFFQITGLCVWENRLNDVVWIEAIGKRGKTIKGGMYVTHACFEEMCRRYLLRGLPEEE